MKNSQKGLISAGVIAAVVLGLSMTGAPDKGLSGGGRPEGTAIQEAETSEPASEKQEDASEEVPEEAQEEEKVTETEVGMAAEEEAAAEETEEEATMVWEQEEKLLVRISAEKELVLRRFNRVSSKTRQVVGGTLTIDPESLEGASRYKAKDIEKILMMGARSASLDSPVGEDGDTTLGDCIASESEATDALAAKNNEQASLDLLLKDNLTDQEHKVIGLYYGLDVDADLNLKEIGKMVGLSKERVRQVKEKALAKLRSTKIDQILDAA